MARRRRGCGLLIVLLLLAGAGLVTFAWWGRAGATIPLPAPLTPRVARQFDEPLQPPEAFGPYVEGISGPNHADSRYGVANPAWGDESNCFRDTNGNAVPFRELVHAGIDLFGLNEAGQVVAGQAAHAPVLAVADGVVIWVQDAGSAGHIVITEHRLADDRRMHSSYWHVEDVLVQPGQAVTRGQRIAAVFDQGGNSHLHWEMHTFRDGTSLFPAGSAGARGTCNGRFAAVGYTWDDDPARAQPDFYGYVDPRAFTAGQ